MFNKYRNIPFLYTYLHDMRSSLPTFYPADVVKPKSVYTACNTAHFILLHTLYASLRAVILEQLPIGSVSRGESLQYRYTDNKILNILLISTENHE